MHPFFCLQHFRTPTIANAEEALKLECEIKETFVCEAGAACRALSASSPDERSDIRDSYRTVSPACRCAHAGYRLAMTISLRRAFSRQARQQFVGKPSVLCLAAAMSASGDRAGVLCSGRGFPVMTYKGIGVPPSRTAGAADERRLLRRLRGNRLQEITQRVARLIGSRPVVRK